MGGTSASSLTLSFPPLDQHQEVELKSKWPAARVAVLDRKGITAQVLKLRTPCLPIRARHPYLAAGSQFFDGFLQSTLQFAPYLSVLAKCLGLSHEPFQHQLQIVQTDRPRMLHEESPPTIRCTACLPDRRLSACSLNSILRRRH